MLLKGVVKDLDYHETYTPTTKMTTIRTLMQFVAQYDNSASSGC